MLYRVRTDSGTGLEDRPPSCLPFTNPTDQNIVYPPRFVVQFLPNAEKKTDKKSRDAANRFSIPTSAIRDRTELFLFNGEFNGIMPEPFSICAQSFGTISATVLPQWAPRVSPRRKRKFYGRVFHGGRNM